MSDSISQTSAEPVLTGPGGQPLQYWKGWAFFYDDQGRLVRVREADRPEEYHTSAEQPEGEAAGAAQGDSPACRRNRVGGQRQETERPGGRRWRDLFNRVVLERCDLSGLGHGFFIQRAAALLIVLG